MYWLEKMLFPVPQAPLRRTDLPSGKPPSISSSSPFMPVAIRFIKTHRFSNISSAFHYLFLSQTQTCLHLLKSARFAFMQGFYYYYNKNISGTMENKTILIIAAVLLMLPAVAGQFYYVLQVNPNPFYTPANPFPGDEVVYSVKVEGRTSTSDDANDVIAEISLNETLFEPIKST